MAPRTSRALDVSVLVSLTFSCCYLAGWGGLVGRHGKSAEGVLLARVANVRPTPGPIQRTLPSQAKVEV